MPRLRKSEEEKLERKRAYDREYQKTHRAKYSASRKKWVERNPERARELNRRTVKKWRENHREEYNAYQREYYRSKRMAKANKESKGGQL